MHLEDWTKKIDSRHLPEPLSDLLKEFLAAFFALPPHPNTINPHFMRFSLEKLVEEICSEREVEHLWWKVHLDLARKWASDRAEAGQPVIKLIEQLTSLLDEHLRDDDSQITLKEITSKTLFGIILLSETLSEPKRYFVADNAISIAQAHFSHQAWFRAICAGRTPVGFVMISINEEEHRYYVWRFMIAEPFQGKGYGRRAMQAIKDHVRTLPQANELLISYALGPGSPEGFYKKIGFQPTGEMDGGEIIAKIAL